MLNRAIKIAILIGLLMTPALARADTCGTASGQSPCTLPCTATATPTQILGLNGHRVDLNVSNTGTVVLYVILGHGAAGQDYTYGIPVQPNTTLDLQVQPNPNQNLHTYTSTVSVATQSGSATCVYTELAE